MKDSTTEHAFGPDGVGLRVLVVHNRYRSALPSGENNVVDNEIEMLRDAGVEVSTWIRESDDIDTMTPLEKLELPVRPIWSRRDTSAVAEVIERDRPQILHLHNPYPLVSPGVIRSAKRRGVKVVQSVHNYRHSCLNGLHLRGGEVCTLCLGKRMAWPGVRYACYRGSVAQSAVLATAEALHHPTWKQVDLYFALSEFMAEQLVTGGISSERVVIKANFVDDPGPPVPPGDGFLFAGRLEEAKGVLLLLDAWERSGLDGSVRLVVAGDGPLSGEVERRAEAMQSVEVAGQLSREALADRFRQCAVVVLPSLWFEGLPGVVVEAYAHGRPVIGLAIGGIPEIVTEVTGWLSAPEARALADCLAAALDGGKRAADIRGVYERHYRREAVRDALLCGYRDVIAERGVK